MATSTFDRNEAIHFPEIVYPFHVKICGVVVFLFLTERAWLERVASALLLPAVSWTP